MKLIRQIKSTIKLLWNLLLWGGTFGFLAYAVATFYGFSIPVREVVKEVVVDKPQESVEQLLKEIPPAYGISPLVMAAIIDRESNGQRQSIRFEPGQMARAAKITKNPEQQRMYASSHGLAQVMGWHAPEYNLSWVDLYDNRTNLEVACAILKKGLDRYSHLPKAERLHKALAEYNGSEAYADAVLRKIGDGLIDKYL